MEIRKYVDIEGVVATEDIVEGRMVLFTSHSWSPDFGSWGDLKGVKLPDTSAESARAFYVLGFALDNSLLPIYQPTPSLSWATRMGFESAANVPFTAKVYLTHPANMVGQTVPSGTLALAFAGGVFTVPSGAYLYNANLATPGTFLVVANTADDSADDAGKLKYSASAGVAIVERYNATTKELTFRTSQP
jgi:hypothetical protein